MKRPQSHKDLAEALRDSAPSMDDLSRARLERRVLDAVAAGEGADWGARAPQARDRRFVMLGAGAMVAVAAAAFFMLRTDRPAALPQAATQEAVATYTRFIGERAVARGDVRPELLLETGAGERAQVRFGRTTLDLGAGALMRSSKVDVHDFAQVLLRGAVEVEFHPLAKGRDHLMIDTASAQVFVVGTAFRVECTDDGTRVRVHEGRVRVVPKAGGSEHLLLPGDEVFVHSPAADARESDAVPAEPADEGTDDGSDPRSASQRAARNFAALFAQAEALQHANAQAKSRAVLDTILATGPRQARVRAHTLMAESWASERAFDQANAHYGLAATEGAGTLDGHNALFARARMRERELHDNAGARADYGRYLQEAAAGPHAELCREALCRLGDNLFCRSAGR